MGNERAPASQPRAQGPALPTLWKNPWAQAALLGLLLLIYLWLKDIPGMESVAFFVAVVIGLAILGIVALEIGEGARERGWKEEALDTLKALVVALVLWLGAGFLLNTPSPLSAVASCSMLPELQRGDFVVVQGVEIRAPDITLTTDEFRDFLGDAHVIYESNEWDVPGSFLNYCQLGVEPLCTDFFREPEKFTETRGPLIFYYGQCSIQQSGAALPCVQRVEHNGISYSLNTTNDVVVYTPARTDFYALIGDIVHRSYLVLNVNGQRYYLTKGDNNPILDVQTYAYAYQRGNAPVSEDRVKGKVIARVPWLGYFKLIISGLIQEDAQCREQLVYR